MNPTLRLFIAIELPAPVLAALDEIRQQLTDTVPRGMVRWTRAEGIHLTLKFLGEVPASRREAIAQGLARAAAQPPFTLRIGGMGCFPNFRQPRVVWVGVQGQVDALHRLRDAVEGAIAPLGFPTEKRPFSPHLTLGRVKEAPKPALADLGRRLEEFKVGELGQVHVTGISLMRSELRPDGAVYTRLAHAGLEATDG